MPGTNYDEVAATYDQRYERHAYPGVARAVLEFAGAPPQRVLEVGCGSGHWVALLLEQGHRVTGLDASSGMLAKARTRAAAAALVKGYAEALPFASGSFERIIVVNALHHFSDARRALQEARRVLSGSGALLVIGLDPACDQDSWCIYDYFPGALERDRQRFATTSQLRESLADAGFGRCHSYVAERIEQDVPATEALESGALARHTTSQLSELSDADYAAGLAAIQTAAAAAEARGETLRLRARLHLFATVAQNEGGGT